MPYDVLDEYKLSSLKREIEQSLGNVEKAGEKLDSYKHDLVGRLSELDSALSSLERATDERTRELQRNAAKTSGYVSYSSVESNIRSARRSISTLMARIRDGGRDLDVFRQLIQPAGRDVSSKFGKLLLSHKSLTDEVKKLSRVVKAEQQKALLAGVAVLSACAKQGGDANESKDASERIAEIEESCDRKIAELTAQYESKIAALSDAAVQERYESRIKRISDLLEDKKLELRKSNADLEAAGAELEDARRLNQTLSIELSQERSCVANYKAILKKRTVAYLIMRMLLATRRFVINWYLYLAAGFVLICFAIILYGLFA